MTRLLQPQLTWSQGPGAVTAEVDEGGHVAQGRGGGGHGGAGQGGAVKHWDRTSDDVRKTTCPLTTMLVPTCALVSVLGPGAGLYGPVEVHQSVGRPGK